MEVIILILLALILLFYLKSKARKLKNVIKYLTSEEKKILQEKVLFYKKLTNEEQLEFEHRMIMFLNQIQKAGKLHF